MDEVHNGTPPAFVRDESDGWSEVFARSLRSVLHERFDTKHTQIPFLGSSFGSEAEENPIQENLEVNEIMLTKIP